jgi:ribosomal protein S18 acetylase RimI-like enzyme
MQRVVTTIATKSGLVARCITSAKGSTGYINSLVVSPEFRRERFGSILLNNAELCLQQQHKVNQIRLLAWQPQGENLTSFFEKNNYKIMGNTGNNHYDDGEYIFELVQMYKNVPGTSIELPSFVLPTGTTINVD